MALTPVLGERLLQAMFLHVQSLEFHWLLLWTAGIFHSKALGENGLKLQKSNKK